MRSTLSLAATAITLIGNTASAQGRGNWGSGSGNAAWAGMSCMGDCWNTVTSTNCNTGDIACLCSNGTAVDALSTCISASSCSQSDKDATYQTLSQICANTGNTLTESAFTSYPATSGGSAYPTQYASYASNTAAWSSFLSSVATLTTAPSGAPTAWGGRWNTDGSNSTSTNGHWNGGNGYGPFGAAGAANGWGPYASHSSGAWTAGPWTSWWGGSACPAATWSGWTSGPWGTQAPWTSWAGCSATTTASSVVTTTATSAGVTSTGLSTSFGVQVAAVTNTASAAATSASQTGAAGRNVGAVAAVAGAGVLAVLVM